LTSRARRATSPAPGLATWPSSAQWMTTVTAAARRLGWAARSHLPGHENKSKTGCQISMQSPWHLEPSVLKEDMCLEEVRCQCQCLRVSANLLPNARADAKSGLCRLEELFSVANCTLIIHFSMMKKVGLIGSS
jgi:hypothetical protein